MWKCALHLHNLTATCTPPSSAGFSWGQLASIVTVLAFVGGIAVAIYFTVSIAGESHEHLGKVTVAVRPSITALGYFKFVPLNASVSVVEFLRSPGGELVESPDEWGVDDVFGNQFANGGETLCATTAFNVGTPPGEVVGWMVRVSVVRKTRLGRFALKLSAGTRRGRWLRHRLIRRWNDRSFVARP
jgi:hypothetical protein